jgi:hypothetical protein
VLCRGLVDLWFILNLKSSKFRVEITGHLQFDAANFAIVFSVDLKCAFEMVEGVTAGEVEAKLGKFLLGFEELGDIEVDFAHFFDLNSQVFFHVQ